jgi:acyl carrier protein
MNNKTAFYRDLADLLELAPDALTGAGVLADLEGWDSVAVISFIAMADEKYGVNVPAKRIAECHTVDDLAAVVSGIQAQPLTQ